MTHNLEDKLLAYAQSDAYAFHMPGHKRVLDPIGDWLKLDITEIDDFDNLHEAEGILREEMDAAAELYGAKETLFSVNGSTCALLAAVSAAVPKGGTLLIERTCHMAVYHAAYLRELNLKYIGEDEFDREADFDAVVITSPTYEGCMKDVGRWARYAHAHGASLIVDEAHGAHLGFHPYFPESAVRCGADLVVQSTHKTLPAMTQTALLHNVTGRVPTRRLQFFMDIYETSSPSYVLMASITGVLRMVREHGEELFEAYAGRLRQVRRELCSFKYFSLAGGEDAVLSRPDELPPCKVGTKMDPGKLVLVPTYEADTENYGANWLYGVLRDEYHLQMEMRTESYCLAMTSFADTEEGFGRLVTALREIDERIDREIHAKRRADGEKPADERMVPEVFASRTAELCGPEASAEEEKILRVPVVRETGGPMKLSDALDAGFEMVALADAEGRVCADFVILYPPDVPLVVPGEIYTESKIREIRGWIEKGFSVPGVDM